MQTFSELRLLDLKKFAICCHGKDQRYREFWTAISLISPTTNIVINSIKKADMRDTEKIKGMLKGSIRSVNSKLVIDFLAARRIAEA
jgi:hypothetical protein